MKARKMIKYFVIVLMLCSISQAAELLIEDFESYADSIELSAVWKERNTAVVALSLETLEAKDGYNSLVVDYNSRVSPYWSETYTIYPENQDWSAYNTLNVWVKGYVGTGVPGQTSGQSNENMYAVMYKPKPEYPDPISHDQLSMLGKVAVYRATQIADWTLLQFNLATDFEPLTKVCAIGIGISPYSYGPGVVKLDGISLSTESYGGIINDFERYENTAQLQSALDVNEGNSVCSTMELALAIEDANVIYGDKALKFSFDNGLNPFWSKVMFRLLYSRSIKYAWGPATFNYGMNYNPLTINFKVMDAEGKMQVALIGEDGLAKAYYKYNDGQRITIGDWVRWDINPQTVYNDPESLGTELDAITRVEIQFVPIGGDDYGTGIVYLDDIHLNYCGQGVGAPVVGNLKADFNQDCVIGFMDFVAFAEHWQQTGCTAGNQYCGGADFLVGPDGGVRDGVVNTVDLDVVFYRWLDCNMLYQGDCF
ncbi:MAG: hypothetical protein A2Y10_07510 [Planctomycetes bacterium GWF2_41_51]|nr:MAG: hypothetical protein A2Y10_07510 [Planctomycetes bacterium GWF2_41_51]HBG27202.1 hypothetical protein [Phycisphaerales bacterium]